MSDAARRRLAELLPDVSRETWGQLEAYVEILLKWQKAINLIGPATVDDGSQNFAGALRSALGVCGAGDIEEFQKVELVIAPAIVSEGKLQQRSQHVGMGS